MLKEVLEHKVAQAVLALLVVKVHSGETDQRELKAELVVPEHKAVQVEQVLKDPQVRLVRLVQLEGLVHQVLAEHKVELAELAVQVQEVHKVLEAAVVVLVVQEEQVLKVIKAVKDLKVLREQMLVLFGTTIRH